MFTTFSLERLCLTSIEGERTPEALKDEQASFEFNFNVNLDLVDSEDGTKGAVVTLEMVMTSYLVDQSHDDDPVFNCTAKWQASYKIPEETFDALQDEERRKEIIPYIVRSLYPVIRIRTMSWLEQFGVAQLQMPWDFSVFENPSTE